MDNKEEAHRRFVEFTCAFYRSAGWEAPVVESNPDTPVAFKAHVDDVAFSIATTFNGMLQSGVQPDASSYIAMIAAYQRDGQSAEKIGRLFSQAIHERHFDPGLGYVLAESEGGEAVPMLDLRANAIALEPAQDAPPVSVHFALALLQHHKAQGHVDEDTQFVVDAAIKADFEEVTGIRC